MFGVLFNKTSTIHCKSVLSYRKNRSKETDAAGKVRDIVAYRYVGNIDVLPFCGIDYLIIHSNPKPTQTGFFHNF